MLNVVNTKIKPLSSDVMFKAVFKKNPNILQKMVCDIIEFTGKIESFNVCVGEELLPSYRKNRKYITDLIVTINEDIKVNIEINRYGEEDLEVRNIIYFSHLIGKIDTGTDNKDLSKIKAFQINFNDFKNSKANAVSKYAYQDEYPPYRRINNFKFFDYDIAKCFDLVYNVDNKEISIGSRWAALIKTDDLRYIDKILGDDMIMKKDKFLDSIHTISNDDNIVQAWMLEEKYRLKEMGQLKAAKKEGIKETISNVIKKMLNNNMDYETIAMVTDTSIDEITKIANSMNS